ncbi:hypothetical protein [Flavobacterium caseinilyticum]|uniref:DUF4199 domain-containing protein n=1 Tax=Flavobacterium caseinilyticum TaxID=2541732 RepID=A0A4R5AR22_9FLAO|nr:hypothetical protein [Flavobacterium caseinilyticum]TDD75153.1 hypothetical protein E0F89_12260 [Flavobacterium caseinilyticum]
MKKTLTTLMILLLTTFCFSQTFKDYERRRLNSFEINLSSIDLNNSTNYLNLVTILEKDKKRIRNKTIGIVLTSLSALATTFGIMVISNSKNDREGVGQSIGTMFIAVGTIELGVSIPLFISSKKRKKERNKLIEYYR